QLIKKDVEFYWGPEQETAFKKVISCLTTAPVLAAPDWSKPFILTTDGSAKGIAAILSQKYDEGEKIICYASRSLNNYEAKYSPTHLEGLAVIWAVKHFHHYLAGNTFTLRTDHVALISIFAIKTPLIGCLARWSMILREYDFNVEHTRG